MSMNKAGFVIMGIMVLMAACKTKSKIHATDTTKTERLYVPVSDITLFDKPLDTIKKHVTGQRWQLWYAKGGMTGEDRKDYTNTFYTLTTEGILITEKGGVRNEKPYKWQKKRDIFTGDSTYVISGIVQWKVEGIYKDTLRLADNFVDGYGYALTRIK